VSTSSPGYGADIKPLFRELDRTSMLKVFDLWDYTDVVAHRDAILDHLAEGSMPCDGPWPAANVDMFRRWVEQGTPS
jgi:hypothetical protein